MYLQKNKYENMNKTYDNQKQMLSVYPDRLSNGKQKYQVLLINRRREI